MATPPVVLQKGFRPFFFLAALFALSFLPLWLFTYTGRLQMGGQWTPSSWHGHEMVFGFAIAVVAGFLLTAVSNWTARVTAIGWPLAALCALWLAGRVVMILSNQLDPIVVAAIDLLFVPALGFTIGRPIFLAKSKRNMKFIAIFVVLFATNLSMHLNAMGLLQVSERSALLPALDLIILITLIISGRVVPMFTRNATGAMDIRSHPRLEKLTFTFVIASIILQTFPIQKSAAAIVALLAGVFILSRQVHWGFQHTLKIPILWVLHVAHAWLGVGFLLRGLVHWAPGLSESAATHALTVGGLGMMIIGMMVRVSLGHTARTIEASRLMTAAFAMVGLAAVGRTFLPWIWPALYIDWVIFSGSLFALAFLGYVIQFAPVLFSPRADGRPG